MAAEPIVPGMPASVIRLYTSLIFIILSFVLGAFASNGFPALTPAPAATAAAPIEIAAPPKHIAGSLEVGDLFVHGTDGINESKAAAFAQVLRSHDLDFRATVYPDAVHMVLSDDDAIELAVRRALALTYYLLGEGVPRSAVSIYASNAGADEYGRGIQARLSFLVEPERK